MRYVALTLVFLISIIVVLPALLARGCGRPFPEDVELGLGEPYKVDVYDVGSGRLVTMGLERYIMGVVAAEVPASFGFEALKAQAIVARTYAVKRMRAFGGRGCERYPGADICTDPAHDQAWASDEQLRSRWGFFGYRRWWSRVEQAVLETRGVVVCWNGQPIDPVYHSTCGGITEDSEQVWDHKIPYLRSVTDPFCAHSPHSHTVTRMSYQLLAAKLGPSAPALAAAAGPRGTGGVQVLEKSPSGRVKKLRLGDVVLDQRALRSVLGLKSTRFNVTADADGVVFDIRGFGHGVGLCQYGADGMSRRGFKAEDIIKYYYNGVTLESLR